MDRLCPKKFQENHVNGVPFVENLLILNVMLFDVNVVDGNSNGERRTQNCGKTARLLKHNTRFYRVTSFKAVCEDSVEVHLPRWTVQKYEKNCATTEIKQPYMLWEHQNAIF